MTTVAVIVARGGSKRIPRKNLRPFCGTPILDYSIRAALESHCFDEVMVSTDDDEIAERSLKLGASVPFRRSLENSNDFAGTAEVVAEVLKEFASRGRQFDFVCCLYPTAPFVTPDLLRAAEAKMLGAPNAHGVIPVVKFGYPIQRAVQIVDDHLQMIWPENMNLRSQDLPPAYHDAGQFYWLRVASFVQTPKLWGPNTVPLIVPEWMMQDIDNENDWDMAEIKYQAALGRLGTRMKWQP